MYGVRSIVSVASDKRITSRNITVHASEFQVLDKNSTYIPDYDYESMMFCHFCGSAGDQVLILEDRETTIGAFVRDTVPSNFYEA